MANFPGDKIALPIPSESLEFNGERYVFGVRGEIAHEHYLRYLFAAQFCAGKDVLDIASGEGYGSCILGEIAATVHGMDLSEQAIEFARRSYTSPRLSFSRGDVRDIPHKESSFDVVVSFETLEHIDEHDQFLLEIKRVLRPGGLLVMSSPDRDVYLRGLPPNPFHRRELNRAEFHCLIGRYFDNRIFGVQRWLAGAVLFPDDPGTPGPLTTFVQEPMSLVRQTNGLAQATYLVAVAADAALPVVTWSVLTEDSFVQDQIRPLVADVQRLMSDITFLRGENFALQQKLAEIARSLSDEQTHGLELQAEARAALRQQRSQLLKDVLTMLL